MVNYNLYKTLISVCYSEIQHAKEALLTQFTTELLKVVDQYMIY